MKKSISALSASLLLACNSVSAIPFAPGSNMVVIFSTAGQGSFYIDSGVSSNDIANGAGFSIDISSATSALGGNIENFAVLGINNTSSVAYNYSELLYTEPGQGLLYAQSTPGTVSVHNTLENIELNLRFTMLANANLGYNAAGSLGDVNTYSSSHFFGNAFGVGLLNSINNLTTGSNDIRLFHQYDSADVTSFQPVQVELSRENQEAIDICSSSPSGYESFEQCMEFYDFPYGGAPAFLLENNTFSLRSAAIPIPSAAWLFLSAGCGLIFARRQRRSHNCHGD